MAKLILGPEEMVSLKAKHMPHTQETQVQS